MPKGSMFLTRDLIASALAMQGMMPRGCIVFDASDDPPAGPSGAPAKAAVLVGHAGASQWPHFEAWRATQPGDIADPLDTWSRLAIGAVAAQFSARAVSPSDRPWLPFQQWAMRAERLKPSPLGLLMHPEYGLWHAYRGALLFEHIPEGFESGTGRPATPIHLCDGCAAKPCLKSCPVDAYGPTGFAYQACIAHVRSPAGSPCMGSGCQDRNACPYGAAYRYPEAVQAFHMRAYARG